MTMIDSFSMVALYDVLKSVNQSMFLWGLLSLIVLDVTTGILSAIVGGEVDSDVGLKGLIKHTTIIILVVFTKIIARIINIQWVSQSLCIFYILQYVFSMIENLNNMGIPFPTWLKNTFNRMSQDYDEGNFKQGGKDVR